MGKTEEACFCFLCFHFNHRRRQHGVKFKQQKQKQQTVDSSSRFALPPVTSMFVFILLLFSPVFPTISGKKLRQDHQIFRPREESNKMKLVQAHLKKINKPFVKSIQSPDGDIIDCVVTHHQPAFDHPKLKGKKPLDPPERPYRHDQAENRSENYQLWSLSGESCPEGTIPIRRTSEQDILRANSIRRFGRKARPIRRDTSSYGHEHAVGYVSGNKYYGAKASINVWAPRVANRYEFSLSQLWVISGSFGNDLNTIEAGWQVYTRRFIMETRATETTESSPVLPVTSTATTETLDQSTPPVVVVDHTRTIETLEQSPPLVANIPPAEVSPPQVTNKQVTEETTLQEVVNTHETAPSGESAPLSVTNIPAAETLDQSTLPPLEDIKTTETVEHSVVASDVTDNSHENLIASHENL